MYLTQSMITLLATIGALVVGALGYKRLIMKDVKKNAGSEAAEKTAINIKLDYISNNINSILLDMKDFKNDMKNQDTRINVNEKDIVRVEEIAKSAHKRIDEVEIKINK